MNTTSLHILLQQYGRLVWSPSFGLYQDWGQMKIKLTYKKTITIYVPDEEKVGDEVPFHVISTYLPPGATAVRWEETEDEEPQEE